MLHVSFSRNPLTLNLLFVLENYYPNVGGVETLFKTLIEQLAADGHSVTLVTTKLSKDAPFKEEQGNLTIYRYPFSNRYFFTFFALFPILPHARKADLIHTTSYNAGVPAFFAGKLMGKKVLITFHEVWGKLWFRLPYMSQFAKILHYSFEQFLLKLPFDRFIAVSESTKKQLVKGGIKEEKITVNHNGIDYDKYQSPTPINDNKQPFTFTYCGRLGISKGIDIFLEAAGIFIKKHPNSRIRMVIPKTPKPLYKSILAEIEKHQLKSNLILNHHLSNDELVQELRQTNCVVIASYSEGFCFMAAECIAMGIPIISSDLTALKEVVSGRFIKMKEHTVDGLLAALEKAKEEQWEQTPIKRFELTDTVNRYIALYQELGI